MAANGAAAEAAMRIIDHYGALVINGMGMDRLELVFEKTK
jgi:hypothetical protein